MHELSWHVVKEINLIGIQQKYFKLVDFGELLEDINQIESLFDLSIGVLHLLHFGCSLEAN